MKKSKRLSDIGEPRKAKIINLSHIRDYDKINAIYEHYMLGRTEDRHWFTMANMIKDYGEFRFLMDILIFLREKTTQRRHRFSEAMAHDVYTNIHTLYFEKLTI